MCSGSHVIMMASDLETDPSDVKEFNCQINCFTKIYNYCIKMEKTNSFKNYNLIKLVLNFIFQNIMIKSFNFF